MPEETESGGTSVVDVGADRIRPESASASHAARRALDRFRRRRRSLAAATPDHGSKPAADDTPVSPTDLADADVSVQRAWRSVRLLIAIVVTVGPIVAALISWRIRVARARRRGLRIDL